MLNGAGECTGFLTAGEWGLLETPDLPHLDHAARPGLRRGLRADARASEPASADDVVIPVVGECDDSFLNDARRMQVTRDDVAAAWQAARGLGRRVDAAGRGRGRRRAPGMAAWASRAASARRRASCRPATRSACPADDELRAARSGSRSTACRSAGCCRPTRQPADRGARGSCIGVVVTDAPARRRRRARGSPAGSGSAWPAPARWRTTAAARSSSACATGLRADRDGRAAAATPVSRARRWTRFFEAVVEASRGGGPQLDARPHRRSWAEAGHACERAAVARPRGPPTRDGARS